MLKCREVEDSLLEDVEFLILFFYGLRNKIIEWLIDGINIDCYIEMIEI